VKSLSEEASKTKRFSGHQRTLDLDRFFIAALDKYKAATGYGDTYAIFNILNEYLHEHGFMDEEAYQYHKKKYGITLLEEAKRMLELEKETQQPQKPIVVWKPKSRPDYSKMSLEELEKRLNHLREAGETTEVQFVSYEIKKRLAEKGVSQ
jgi:hypothetical protein